MGINIDDLEVNSSSNATGASLLSGNETVLDNLRELSPEELRTTGGGKKGGGSVYIDNGFGGFFFEGDSGGKKGGGGPTVISRGAFGGSPGGFGGNFGGFGIPIGIPVGGFGGFPSTSSFGSFPVGSTGGFSGVPSTSSTFSGSGTGGLNSFSTNGFGGGISAL